MPDYQSLIEHLDNAGDIAADLLNELHKAKQNIKPIIDSNDSLMAYDLISAYESSETALECIKNVLAILDSK